MTTRSPLNYPDESLSSIERLYLFKLSTARYAYESSHTQSVHLDEQRNKHISVIDFDLFASYFSLDEYACRLGQTHYYEHPKLALAVGAYAAYESYDQAHPSSGELYLHDTTGQTTSYTQVVQADISSYISDHFRCEDRLSPRFTVTYRARLMRGSIPHTADPVWCIVEDEVSYHEPQLNLTLSSETHSRVYWLSPPPSLGTLETIPLSSRYWMGEYHYKRLYRLPCYNELEGYEYEAKLTPQSLTIDEELLPYKVIERYQTESIRWYLPKGKGRISFRESRVSFVKKGKKVLLDGIIKRPEEKIQGLSMWSSESQLSQPVSALVEVQSSQYLQMRRIKRQLYLLHPQSHRVYALCLDDCRADGKLPFTQIELEYNGRLCLPIQTFEDPDWLSFSTQSELAHHLAQDHPKAALRCVERALLFAPTKVPPPHETNRIALSELMQTLKQELQSKLHRPKTSIEIDFQSIEQAVIKEMRVILNILIKDQGCRPSVQTKRSWLSGKKPKKSKRSSSSKDHQVD